MAKAKKGDRVKVHYTGKLSDGTVFDSSRDEGDEGPLEFCIGEEMLIPAFEDTVIDMAPGETREIQIPCDEAYGPSNEELIFEVDLEEIPGDKPPEVGAELELVICNEEEESEEEEVIPVLVMEVNEKTVRINANHPLADQDLSFEIELLEIL